MCELQSREHTLPCIINRSKRLFAVFVFREAKVSTCGFTCQTPPCSSWTTTKCFKINRCCENSYARLRASTNAQPLLVQARTLAIRIIKERLSVVGDTREQKRVVLNRRVLHRAMMLKIVPEATAVGLNKECLIFACLRVRVRP